MSEIQGINQNTEAARLQQVQELQSVERLSPQHLDIQQVDMSTTVASYGDFAGKFPKLNQVMLQSVAQSILGDMRRHEQRLKEIIREGSHK